MALSEIIRKLFRLLLRVEICLRVLSLAFAVLFHSVYVCVCVFFVSLTCHQQRWPESSFLLNILNFVQKKIQVLGMVEPSESIARGLKMFEHWLCEQFSSFITQIFGFCVRVQHMR